MLYLPQSTNGSKWQDSLIVFIIINKENIFRNSGQQNAVTCVHFDVLLKIIYMRPQAKTSGTVTSLHRVRVQGHTARKRNDHGGFTTGKRITVKKIGSASRTAR